MNSYAGDFTRTLVGLTDKNKTGAWAIAAALMTLGRPQRIRFHHSEQADNIKDTRISPETRDKFKVSW